jgi:hypothetical protein
MEIVHVLKVGMEIHVQHQFVQVVVEEMENVLHQVFVNVQKNFQVMIVVFVNVIVIVIIIMAHVLLLVYVIVFLVGLVQIVQFQFVQKIVMEMDIVYHLQNANVKMDGVELIVQFLNVIVEEEENVFHQMFVNVVLVGQVNHVQ